MKHPSKLFCRLVVFAACLWSAAVPAQTVRQTVSAHVPAVARLVPPLAPVASTQRLSVAISLPFRNRPALTNLLRQINDPTGPKYHRFLTREQFTEQFGPSLEDYNALKKFADSNGLRVNAEHANRMLLEVGGTVADIQRAFHTTLNVYKHPTEPRTFYAPSVEPSLDLTTPVLSIGGLDNFTVAQPRLQAVALANKQNALPNAGSGPVGTYMGHDFRAAYMPDVSLTGSGQTIGLLQFDGYSSADITYYKNLAGLPDVPIQNVLLNGATGYPSGSGGEVEVSLDIQMVISMAPGLNQVIVYEAPNPSPFEIILNRMVSDNSAKQLSCSWYIPHGSANPAAEQIFLEMAAQGQTFFNASGDSDAYTGLIDFPGDSPNITQVGGTTLSTTGPGGARTSETVWNRGDGVGSGGGISTQYPIPYWQTNIDMSANQGSATMRNSPDVALTAENIYVRANGSDYRVIGTSCAAPLWAGFAALVNQEAAVAGQPSIGFINPAIDKIASGSSYSSCFFDITTGDNTSSASPAQFYAHPGYDLCTGWGCPAGQHLIDALANPEALHIFPDTGFSSLGGVGGPFTVTLQNLTLTNGGTNTLTWTLANPVSWLDVAPTGGTLNPGATATVAVSLNSAASNLTVGSYSGAVWFTNLNSHAVFERDYSLAVLSPPSITEQPADQSVLDGAVATFSVTADGGVPMFYQWQLEGTNLMDGGEFVGVNTTNLIVTNASPADAGTYSVIVTNVAGSATSSNALLTILDSAPVITVPPASQTVVAGQTVTFIVAAVGTKPFSYQWTYGGVGGTNIDGATNAALVLPAVQLSDAGLYSVIVSNALGSATSPGATLNVIEIPIVTGLNPSAGFMGTNIVITGLNFSPIASANTVYFGAVRAAITSGSSSSLNVIVPTNATFAPVSVTVNGLTAYSAQRFMPVFPGVGVITNDSFTDNVDLPTPHGPQRVFIADLDGDGKPDLIVANAAAGVLSVFQNIGTNGVLNDGSFAPRFDLVVSTTPAGTDPYDVAAVDLDGDGRLDLVTLNADNNVVAIFRNISTPGPLTTNSFDTRIDLPAGNGLRGLAVQDLDRDGKPEIVTGNQDDGNISIFKNDSTTGSIVFEPRVNFDAGDGATGVAIGDVDGDGLPDLVSANYYENTISVFRNLGQSDLIDSNSFAPAVDFPAPANPFSLAFGDMDGDGKPDLVVGGANGSSTIAVYRNVASPGSITTNSLGAPANFGAAGWVNFLALADLDGDGKLDIALVTQNNNAFSIFKNVSTPGNFDSSSLAPRVDFPTGANANGLSLGDLDGDGRPDAVFANYYSDYFTIYKNDIQFSGAPVITSQPANQGAVIGGTANFSVTASGADPLNYQWFFNGTNSLPGATNSTLTLTNVQLSDGGFYSVVVANFFASVTSTNAMLLVNPSPADVPAITGVTPPSSFALSNATISGLHFSDSPGSNIVYFGAVRAAVIQASTTSLTVVVPTNASFAPVTVTVNGLTASANQSFMPTFPGGGQFDTTSLVLNGNLPAGSGPIRTFIADLDGDGLPDLIVGNASSGAISIYRNLGVNGDLNGSSFASPVTLFLQSPNSGADPYTLATADLDGDGRLDIIALDADNGLVSIFRNISSPGSLTSGSFGARLDYIGGSAMRGIAVRDLDGDGRPEVVTANQNGNNISIFKNTSSRGNISFVAKVDFAADSGPQAIAIGDLDGDGLPDIAVANLNASTVSLFRNLGEQGMIDGNSFAPAVNLSAPATADSIALGDLDGDGKLDMVVGGASGPHKISVYRNIASSGNLNTGSFAPAVDFATSGWVNYIALADLDGNGKLDIAVDTQSPGALSVFKNISSPGSFTTASLAPRLDFPASANPNGLFICDLNGDGRPDLAAGNYYDGTVSIYKNVVLLSGAPVITSQPTNQTVVVGDTATFAVTATGASLGYQWHFNATNDILGATNSVLSLTNVQLTASGLYSVTVSNFGGAVLSSNAMLTVFPSLTNVPVILNFSPASAVAGASVTINGLNFSNVASNDLVRFGAVQAAVTAAGTNTLTVAVPTNATFSPLTVTVSGMTAYSGQCFVPAFPGSGAITNTSFTDRADITTPGGPERVFIADLDGDGKPDLIVADAQAGSVSIFQNISTNGTLNAGSFAPRFDLPVGGTSSGLNPYSLTTADIDGDGKLDIIVLNALANFVSVFRNISTPGLMTTNSFATRVDFPAGSGLRAVAVRDLDGDGKPDIVVGNQNDANISIFKNNSSVGSIALAPRVNFAAGNGATGVAIGDIDGDGKPDIAVANYSAATISVFRNLGLPGLINSNSFAAPVNFSAPANPFSLEFGDMDGDGKLDLVVGGANGSSTVAVYRNTATPGSITTNSLASAVNFGAGGWVNFLALADLDGDGKLDVAIVTQSSATFSVFKNQSVPGSFSASSLAARVSFSTGNNPNGLSLGDLDGDGRPDAVFGNFYSGNISVYHNVIPFGAAPAITLQPTNALVSAGNNVTFTSAASGTAPFGYQWYFNGSNAISAATNASLTLTNVQMTNAGNYSVTVTNRFGSTSSSNAVLTVTPLHHFGWAVIPSPRFLNAPFTVTIFAQDITNGTFAGFTGTVTLSSSNGVPVAPQVSGNFSNGVWTGTVTVTQLTSGLILKANDDPGHVGFANAIDIVSPPTMSTLNFGTSLLVSWPVAPSGFVLESSSTLLPGDWTPVSGSPVTFNGQNLQSVPLTNTNQFFRLRFNGP